MILFLPTALKAWHGLNDFQDPMSSVLGLKESLISSNSVSSFNMELSNGDHILLVGLAYFYLITLALTIIIGS